MNLRKLIRQILREEAVTPIRPLSSIEQYIQMSPADFAHLSKEEVADILNEVLPKLDELSEQIKKLEWIFDQVKDARLLKEAQKFKDNTLRYRNVLVTLVEQSYSDPRVILKRLTQENPKLTKIIEKIKSEETRTIEKIRKAVSTDRMRPNGYPDKPERVMTESFIGKIISSVSMKTKEFISRAWTYLFSNINEELEGMIEEVDV